MSLRMFHVIFILIATVGADLFGVWAVWNWKETGDVGMLALGVVSILGGLGLVVYLVRLIRVLDAQHIH